jgi:hypothetical protein
MATIDKQGHLTLDTVMNIDLKAQQPFITLVDQILSLK